MSNQLDELFRRLARAPTDRSLDSLEAEIARAIGLHQREVRNAAALTPVRIASIGLALAMGVTVGGVAAAAAVAHPHPAVGATSAIRFAPSNLLEGGAR